MSTTGWPEHCVLPANGDVHVWSAFLTESRPQLAAFASVLSIEEKERAACFLRPDDRARYLIAHGVLRQLLGRCLSAEPSALGFVLNEYGKPALAPGGDRPPLAFNLAHSGEAILLALAVGCRVGVDVEAIRPGVDVMDLARGQFSPAEVRALETTVPGERTAAFFRCWTRKEAYLKARGEGLSFSLKQFSVSFGRDEPPGVLWAVDEPAVTEHWSVMDVSPLSGYAGAVACERRPVRLVTRHWRPAG